MSDTSKIVVDGEEIEVPSHFTLLQLSLIHISEPTRPL